MKSFKMAVAELRRDLVQQGLTPIYPGQPIQQRPRLVPEPLQRGPLIGRIARTHDEALAWVLRFQITGRQVRVSALRSGYLVFVRAA